MGKTVFCGVERRTKPSRGGSAIACANVSASASGALSRGWCSPERLTQAAPHLTRVYGNYRVSRKLEPVLREDVSLRFSTLTDGYRPSDIAAVLHLTESIATARNATRF